MANGAEHKRWRPPSTHTYERTRTPEYLRKSVYILYLLCSPLILVFRSLPNLHECLVFPWNLQGQGTLGNPEIPSIRAIHLLPENMDRILKFLYMKIFLWMYEHSYLTSCVATVFMPQIKCSVLRRDADTVTHLIFTLINFQLLPMSKCLADFIFRKQKHKKITNHNCIDVENVGNLPDENVNA